MDPEKETAASPLAEPGPQPISLKDVLRAVFMPPQEEQPAALPAIRAPRLRLPSGTSTPATGFDLAELSKPTTIHYEESPVEPIGEASPQRMTVLGIGVMITILIAYLAQSSLTNQQSPSAGLLLYGLAVLIWLGLLAFEIAPPDGGLLRRGPRIIGGGAARHLQDNLEGANLLVRAMLAALGLTLSVAAYVFSANNTFTAQGVIAWILSIATWMVVAAERKPDQLLADIGERLKSLRVPRPTLKVRHLFWLAAFVAILGAAIFFRFYRLDAIPNEMTSDHVEKLLDAYDVSQGEYHIFFPRNGGREAIQFYLVALASRLFGTGMSFLTLKLVSALEALALIPLILWVGRELVDWETGFFAAALLAISWWDTALGRLGLRIILTPLIFSLVLVMLVRGLRTGSRKAWLWAGVWMGVGVYAYQAIRMAPLVVAAALLVAVAGPLASALKAHFMGTPDAPIRRMLAANIVGRQALNLALSGLVALAIFVPMLRYWHDSPAEMWNRVINRTTNNEVAIQGSPTQVFVNNFVGALGMFNVHGDAAWISSLPGAPTLDLITGGLFVLGVAAWAIRLRIRRDPADIFVVLAGMIMLLPSALAIAFPVENPSVTRASGAIPVVFVLAAWPLALIRQRWSAVMGRWAGTGLAAALIAILIGTSAAINYQTYFVQYAASYRNSALNPSEVARAVRQVIGPDTSLDGVWLQGWPYWHDYRAIGIEAGDITFKNAILDLPMLQDYLTNYPDRFTVRPLVFILHPEDTESLAFLKTHFPQGYSKLYPGDVVKHGFYLFIVPTG